MKTATSTRRARIPVFFALLLILGLFPGAAQAAHNPEGTDPCADAPVANEYVDRDQAREVHRTSIDCVIFRSLAVGSTNDDGEPVYEPLQAVTRAQMASFIYNTLENAGYGSELPSRDEPNEFDDIDGNAASGNINSLARAGIVRGVDEDTFDPNSTITRDQMASFIAQAARWAVGDLHPVESDGNDQFTDMAGNPHQGNAEAGADTDPPLFRGVQPGQFRPNVEVLRDQMATFLVNLLRYIFSSSNAPPVVVMFDDSAPPGGEVTGEIRNDADGATVSGCGFEDEPVSDTDPETAGIQFTLTIPATTDPGECTLTFTIETGDEDDDDTVVRDVEITVEESEEPPPSGGGGGGCSQRITLVAPVLVDTQEVATATATVTCGAPRGGVIVDFSTDSAEGNPTPNPESGSDTTEQNPDPDVTDSKNAGQAEFQFNSQTTGVVEVTACIRNTTRCATANVEIVNSPTDIELFADEHYDSGELQTAIAEVRNDTEEQLVQNALVRFRADTVECYSFDCSVQTQECYEGANCPTTQSRDFDRTDAQGRAEFGFYFEGSGVARLEVCLLTVDGWTRCDTRTVTFGQQFYCREQVGAAFCF